MCRSRCDLISAVPDASQLADNIRCADLQDAMVRSVDLPCITHPVLEHEVRSSSKDLIANVGPLLKFKEMIAFRYAAASI